MKGALLVGGTSSDAGKSLIVAGLCRQLRRRGVRVAPFKAQNMSNNSVVTPDGGENGRAQALQAYACGLAPSTRFNPVLLKPGSDRRSHVLVRGGPAGDVGARGHHTWRSHLADLVAEELASLRDEFDVVVEGARFGGRDQSPGHRPGEHGARPRDEPARPPRLRRRPRRLPRAPVRYHRRPRRRRSATHHRLCRQQVP